MNTLLTTGVGARADPGVSRDRLALALGDVGDRWISNILTLYELLAYF